VAEANSVNVDKQIMEDFKELKNEMDKYHLEDPKKFLNVLGHRPSYRGDHVLLLTVTATPITGWIRKSIAEDSAFALCAIDAYPPADRFFFDFSSLGSGSLAA
jgi:hypothetical protein